MVQLESCVPFSWMPLRLKLSLPSLQIIYNRILNHIFSFLFLHSFEYTFKYYTQFSFTVRSLRINILVLLFECTSLSQV